MAIEVGDLPRTFTFKTGNKSRTLEDPDPTMTVDEVLRHYAGTYPELTSASVDQDVTRDEIRVTFATSAGTKG